MAQLEIRNVTHRFGEFVAAGSVSLAIEAGEFFTLLCPSDCRRITILRMIVGFDLPDLAQQKRLEMPRDLGRHQRRVRSRIRTEIKLR